MCVSRQVLRFPTEERKYNLRHYFSQRLNAYIPGTNGVEENRYLLFLRVKRYPSPAEIALVTFYSVRPCFKKRERGREILHYGATYYGPYFLHDPTSVSARAEP